MPIIKSHPVRGAWIEIDVMQKMLANEQCRTPSGVRGLKSQKLCVDSRNNSRTPSGVRGLKFYMMYRFPLLPLQSHPVRGAWIEMAVNTVGVLLKLPSHPVRGAWIEIAPIIYRGLSSLSHPVRGAWIEIGDRIFDLATYEVAPRQGCVD